MLNYAYIGLNRVTYITDDNLVFRGTWSSAGTYSPPYEAVTYGNGNWIALVLNTNTPPLGNSSWSPLVFVGTIAGPTPTPGPPVPPDIAGEALALAQSSYNLASIGTNVGTNAYNLALSALGQSAAAAYNLASIGTNVGTNALTAAAAAQATADSALSGINGVTVIAIAGTNAAATAQSRADSAFNLAAIGTNVGTNAIAAAAAAQVTANNAIGGITGVTVIAIAGTDAAASARSGADAAFALAVTGTNAAAAAQLTGNSAISGVSSVYTIAAAGTNLAQAAYNLAAIGTNVGTNALSAAQSGSNTAWEALVIAQSATNTVYTAPITKTNGTINVPDFIASGSSHSRGLVPDPGAVAGTSKYLREDGTWTALVKSVTFVIDGGGSAITTGVKGDLEIPFACTINQVTLLADQTGDIVVDIWKDTYANYPPTIADKITASAPPTISSGIKSQDATLTGWNKTVSAGDILRFNVNSASAVTRVTLALKVTRT